MNHHKTIAAWMLTVFAVLAVTAPFGLSGCGAAAAEEASPGTVVLFDETKAVPSADNPFNKRDDQPVPYDESRWIQPGSWNTPKIDPRDYHGGIMIYCDMMEIEPDPATENKRRVYFSVTGAAEPVSILKFHIFYDTRLTVKENGNGQVITPGKAINGFTTGSALIEEGQLAFYAYSDNDVTLDRGNLFTIDFVIPQTAGPGDLFPFGMVYVDDGIVCDSFIDSGRSEAAKLQMTYAFTKGMKTGYIRIRGEKPVSETMPPYSKGDVNGDSLVNAKDASAVLTAAAKIGAGNASGLTQQGEVAADVNSDGEINAKDAGAILRCAAAVGAGRNAKITDFI